MKKVFVLFAVMLATLTANAQFEKGKAYVGAKLTGLELASEAKKFHFGIGAQAGYLFADNLMGLAQVGYDHREGGDNTFTIGGGARYYIIQNGLYLGASVKYKHASGDYNDFLPGVQLGYAFFITRTVTIEPELYIDFSTKKFENSCYGLGVTLGVYLFKDQYQLKR